MASRERLETALINADKAGDNEAARVLAQELQALDDTTLLDEFAGVGETALSIGSGFAAEVGGGVAGALTAIPEAAFNLGAQAFEGEPLSSPSLPRSIQVQESISDFLQYDPRTTAGKRNLEAIAGSEVMQGIAKASQAVEQKILDMGVDTDSGPVKTALAVAFPTMAFELIGAGIPGRVGKGVGRVADQEAAKADALGAEIEAAREPLRSDTPVSDEGLEQVSQALQEQTPEQVTELVRADPEFYKASEQLGINTEPLASFASQNPQFRAVEQGLASIPASLLDTQSKAYITDVSQAADNLIERYGGTVDKAELSLRFRDESIRAIDDIYQAESDLYDVIDQSLPKSTRVNPQNILGFLDKKIRDAGGMKKFKTQNPRLAKMYRQLRPKTTRDNAPDLIGMGTTGRTTTELPTYDVLNDIRKEIGQQLGRRGDTSFRSTETGLLKILYSNLKQDQNAVAASNNLADSIRSSDALTIQRKQIEDNLSTLLGKDLSKDLMPTIEGAVKGLAKGRVENWRRTIEAVPENYRSEVVVSALNDVFKGTGAHDKAFNPTKFVNFMENLNRSPETKNLLYRELPEGGRRSLDNLYTISKGISLALGDRIPTGRIAAFFDNQDGVLRKLMEGGVNIAATKMAGPLGGIATSELLKQSTDAAKATANMLASPTFQKLIRNAVTEGTIEGGEISRKVERLEKQLEKTKRYREWSDTLSDSAEAKLSSIGFVNYLLSEEE